MNNNITTPMPSVIENKEKLIFITNNFDDNIPLKTTTDIVDDTEKPEYDIDLDMNSSFFKKTILGNLTDNFYPGYLRGKDNAPELKAEKEEWTKRYFDMFIMKIDKFIDDIDEKKYQNYGDFKFVKTYIIKIFENFYLKKPLIDVFGGNKDIEKKFFDLSEKYLFNATTTYGEIYDFRKDNLIEDEKVQEQKKVSQILTDNEMKQLLDGIRED